MGAVGAGVVTASFFGFHPAFVARAVPAIWSLADPAQVVEARLAGVDQALRKVLPDSMDDACGDAAALLRAALEGCSPAGRPLFAANRDLAWPSEPHLALWHAVTLAREHRGDGHVAALVTAGLDPCEAHITQVAMAAGSLESIKPYRGWADNDYDDAAVRLRARGWLTDDDLLTNAGQDGRRGIENDTDRLAVEPVERLGHDGMAQVTGVLVPLASRLERSGTIPYPNPMGLPLPIPVG